MAGGIIQLAAYGVQDLYLTGDPQITFFKAVHRRHTNFAIESVPQYFSSRADFGSSTSCTITRAGDLASRVFVYVEIPSIPRFTDPLTSLDDTHRLTAWARHLGFALIQEASIEIGGRRIDKQYGEWLYIWSQLSQTSPEAINKLTGNTPALTLLTNGKPGYQLCIPLQFWFCRHTGLAIPLVALAASDVKITISFRPLTDCIITAPTHSISILEDAVPFEQGDYIEQTIKGQTIRGYVIDYDYINKRLYYNKLGGVSASKQAFKAYQTDDTHAYPVRGSTLSASLTVPGALYPLSLAPLQPLHLDLHIDTVSNRPYRIYKTGSNAYATPQPNTIEVIEARSLPLLQLTNAYLLVDYIYLDAEERKKFSTVNHEYLIEQLQLITASGLTSPNAKINLTFNHPCKALYWTAQLEHDTGPNSLNEWFKYTTSSPGSTSSLTLAARLSLNGRDRFSTRTYEYFNWYQPYVHHARGPALGINMYSFSLYPSNLQPSAALNMTLIDQASLLLKLSPSISTTNTARVRVYALSYNILRVACSMGGVAFA